MKNKILIGTLAITALLTVGCGCTSKEKEDKDNETQINEPTVDNPTNITNPEMIKDQNVENLEFSQTSLIYNGNVSILTSQVKNTSDQTVTLSNVIAHITYEDEFGNERILDMMVYFGESLAAGEAITTENTVNVDLRTASNIEYEIVQ